jgi:uncharacterized membrane protein
VAITTAVALVALWPDAVAGPEDRSGQNLARVTATVRAVNETPCPAEPEESSPDPGWVRRCGSATAVITEGVDAGRTVSIQLPQGPGRANLDLGDDVILARLADDSETRVYAYSDHQRSKPLLWLVALAVGAVIALGRWRGITSLFGLAISFAVLALFVIPGILSGRPPVLVAVIGAAAIMFAAFYLTHGVNVHTSVAVLGTLTSLVVTGLLGAGFTALTELTGIAGDDTSYLATMGISVDLRGLLLAGIVIGALGVLDDVTVTQAVTVAEMAGIASSRRELFRSATRIGRAHVAAAVNTIVLAYAGTALPLLLIVTTGPYPLAEILTSESIAQEVVRGAVGTVGLVASVPITTALATLVADVSHRKPTRHIRHRPLKAPTSPQPHDTAAG